ncbi:hypothetical protein [Alkalilimnicola sp. S0819]|uniref:hypothetical protein n=1 Tax=Alkalilimnicola sp. S0819 TaxID=2613922 RepID=UPI001D013F20|nr:hypothetical protein [Alkalilimnicola sp. S0819]
MRTILWLALLASMLIVTAWEPMPVEERLVRIRAEEAVPHFPGLAEEPLEVQAVLVDYARDPLLLLQARAALLRHPEMARAILARYGPEPEFHRVLRDHGPAVLLPIEYFIRNDVGSVAALNQLLDRYEALKWAATNWWDGTGDQPMPAATPLGPAQRGWVAVNFIAAQGHDFLGQFLMGARGEVQWIQTERVLEGTTAFFSSGIRGLEVRALRGEQLRAEDLGWAAVDALVVMSAVKVLRLGRAAAGVGTAARSGRAAGYGSRLLQAGRYGLQGMRYAKWPAAIGVAYLVLNHPALINDALAGLARAAGWPPWLVQIAGWTLLLLPMLYLLSILFRLLAGPLAWLLGRGAGVLRRYRWRARPSDGA